MRAQFAGRLFASETWPSAFPRPGFCFGNRWGRAWFVGGDPRRRPTWAAHSKPLALLPRLTKMGHDEITMKVPWEYLKQSIIQSINLWRYHESKSINYIINQLIDHSFNSSIYLRKYHKTKSHHMYSRGTITTFLPPKFTSAACIWANAPNKTMRIGHIFAPKKNNSYWKKTSFLAKGFRYGVIFVDVFVSLTSQFVLQFKERHNTK